MTTRLSNNFQFIDVGRRDPDVKALDSRKTEYVEIYNGFSKTQAAEQSHRGRLPRVHEPVLFAQACERARNAELALMPWEGEKVRSIHSVLTEPSSASVTVQGKTMLMRRPFSISVFVGCEGGFTSHEVDQALRYGILPVTLGPRILRAETAALVAATIILYQLEDL